MSIKLRFALLLGLLLAGLLLALTWHHQREVAAVEEWLAAGRQTRIQLLQHWIDAGGRTLAQVANDTVHAEEFSRLLASPHLEKLHSPLAAQLGQSGLDQVWIHRGDGSLALAAAVRGSAEAPAPPLAAGELLALTHETPAPHFFAAVGVDLLEVFIRRIPGAGEGPAWLVLARRWDDAHLRGLAALLEAQLDLRPPHEAAPVSADPALIVLQRPLLDWQGHPLRMLLVRARDAEADAARREGERQGTLFLAFGLLLIAATAIALHRWIVRPLGWIGASLARSDLAPLAPLATDRSELGRLAQLARDSFAQKQTLQTEVERRTQAQTALENSEAALRANLEERARLGRDLHDGVIQSLYAAGMGLASIRILLQPGQAEAAARLEQTRAALNETIHDVRNFIIGLEPESLKLQTFSQAIGALLEVMRSHGEFQSHLAIDEEVARRLSLAQRVHALQITREAVSNALRHGAARHLTITLRRPGEFVELEIADDGSGFDPAVALSRGSGLANFRQRARELGAELVVDSEPGRGTRVKLAFSPQHL